MKVLVVHPGPHFSVSDVHDGLVKGLRQNGCEVATLNLHERLNFYTQAHVKRDDEFVPAFSEEAAVLMAAKGLETVCYEYWPDVVVVVSGFFIPPEVWAVLARRPHRTVLWCTESPYEDDRQSWPARYADLVVLNDPTNLESFRRDVNPNTHYFWHSYDPDRHFVGPGDPDLACDFAFVGTGFPSRLEFFEDVDWSGLTVRLGGNWKWMSKDSPLRPFLVHPGAEGCDNDDTARLYRSASVSANLYRKEHSDGGTWEGWAMGPREVELAACGTFFLRESRPEGDELFPMLPTFEESGEFGEKLRWWLDHTVARTKAARQAREAVAGRTFQATAARLLRKVDKASKRLAA